MNSLSATVDFYCERIGPAFWAEPVNAATNAAFLLAALWGWALARRRGRLDAAAWLLIGLVAAIGVGSFLFHTFATRWAAIADVAPIYGFSLAFMCIALRRFFGIGWVAAGVGVVLIAAALLAVRDVLPAWIPGGFSVRMYGPAVLALLGLAAALALARRPGAWGIGAAGLTLALSLYFRSIDGRVCGDFPLGTHFLWHVLNGTMFAILLHTLFQHGRADERAGR